VIQWRNIMGKKVRSAKGEMVDFDFLKIKEGLASAPTSINVRERQDFIESRSKRRIKKLTTPIAEIRVTTDLPTPTEGSDDIAPEKEAEIVDKSTEVAAPKQKARKKKTIENKDT